MKLPPVAKTLVEAAELGSHAHTISDLFRSLFGKVPVGPKAHLAKGIAGFFGSKDEREFVKILGTLDADTKTKHKQTLLGWMEWQFPKGTNEEKLVTAYYGNKFRSFIIELDLAPSEGNIDRSEAKKFLLAIVKTIKTAGGGVAGYEAVRRELRLQNVPIPSETAAETLRRVYEGKDGVFRDAKASLIHHTRRAERQVEENDQKPKSWLRRFVEWDF